MLALSLLSLFLHLILWRLFFFGVGVGVDGGVIKKCLFIVFVDCGFWKSKVSLFMWLGLEVVLSLCFCLMHVETFLHHCTCILMHSSDFILWCIMETFFDTEGKGSVITVLLFWCIVETSLLHCTCILIHTGNFLSSPFPPSPPAFSGIMGT